MDDLTERRLDTLMDLGRHREAETGLRDVLARDPQDVTALRMLSDCLRATDRSEEALAAAGAAVGLAPQNPVCLGTVVECLIDLGRGPEAVDAAYRLVSELPHWWASHYTLGHALWKARRFRDGLTAANEAIRLAPLEGACHNLAGMCLSDLGLDKEAEVAYRRSLELDPHSAVTLNNLAALRLDRGRLGSATGFLRSGLSHDPQNQWLHHNHDQIVMLVVRRLWFAVSAATLASAVLAIVGAAWWGRTLLALGVVIALIATGRYLATRLPGGLTGLHGLWGRVNGWQRVGLVSAGLTSAVALGLGVLPSAIAADAAIGVLAVLRGGVIVFVLVAIVGAVVNLIRRSS